MPREVGDSNGTRCPLFPRYSPLSVSLYRRQKGPRRAGQSAFGSGRSHRRSVRDRSGLGAGDRRISRSHYRPDDRRRVVDQVRRGLPGGRPHSRCSSLSGVRTGERLQGHSTLAQSRPPSKFRSAGTTNSPSLGGGNLSSPRTPMIPTRLTHRQDLQPAALPMTKRSATPRSPGGWWNSEETMGTCLGTKWPWAWPNTAAAFSRRPRPPPR